MALSRNLLMIPGPVEVDPAVVEAYSCPPPSHVAPDLIASFSNCLSMLRGVFLAPDDAQPFVVAGSGTLSMEMAAANIVGPGDEVLVVNTGYFSDRMVEILHRLGAHAHQVTAPLGEVVTVDAAAEAIEAHQGRDLSALFVTHVDTSTGVRVDPEPFARLAREHGMLSVFDGVCATAAETFRMADWGADIYLTGSQKAIGLPAGLAILVASRRALSAREALVSPPPMYLDWGQWLPIMRAYERKSGSYFATPATTFIPALELSLSNLLGEGMDAVFARHQVVADGLRAGFDHLGLELLPARAEIAANTLSAIRYPDGVDASLTGLIKKHGAVVAGGLHPTLKAEYFRVGHMGYATTRHDYLTQTLRAVGLGLRDAGKEVDVEGAVAGLEAALG